MTLERNGKQKTIRLARRFTAIATIVERADAGKDCLPIHNILQWTDEKIYVILQVQLRLW